MVSLRRRKLLGLCAGRSSLQRSFEIPTVSSSDAVFNEKPVLKPESGSSNASACSSSKERQPYPEPPIKRRKRHRRKQVHNQEPCLMRGVYYKNMKWQAAIKVDKKQIHLGTVGSQVEAARLYDRAAFMCGREPNFELTEEEKMELRKFKWEEFLAITRSAINNKKSKRRSAQAKKRADGDAWRKEEFDSFSVSEDMELE